MICILEGFLLYIYFLSNMINIFGECKSLSFQNIVTKDKKLLNNY